MSVEIKRDSGDQGVLDTNPEKGAVESFSEFSKRFAEFKKNYLEYLKGTASARENRRRHDPVYVATIPREY